MKKIGILFESQNTFPGVLVDKINAMNIEGITAEFVNLGGVTIAQPSGYSVIVARISHDMPFYRSYLKNAALTGTHIIDNSFWWSAEDKFFNYALATKLGVAVPKTVLLPHPPKINTPAMRYVQHPLDWEPIFNYVGFPALLELHDGDGWRDVFEVGNPDEFFNALDQTRNFCMILRAAVNLQQYFRCYVIGQSEVRIVPYGPGRPHENRSVLDTATCDPQILKRIENDALALCKCLGHDLNAVEFAVEDGVPYAVDFMNPVPDAGPESLGAENFEWLVDKVAHLAIGKAQSSGTVAPRMNWEEFVSTAAVS